jgi:hypothetical protein
MLFGTYTDCYPGRGITVRMPHDPKLEVELFVGGWRVARYKTARGVRAAIERHREYGMSLPARRVPRERIPQTPYERAYDYARAYEDERWGTASGHAWDRLEAIAAEHQRGERDWSETRRLLDEVKAEAGLR